MYWKVELYLRFEICRLRLWTGTKCHEAGMSFNIFLTYYLIFLDLSNHLLLIMTKLLMTHKFLYI